MQVWLYLSVSVVAAAYVLLWVRSRRARAMLDKLPTYPQLPFIGNMLYLYGGGECLSRRVVEMSRISDERMQPFHFAAGPCHILLCHDPEDVKTIANNLVEKPYYYNFGKIWLGDGLVTAPGTIWKHTVKKLSGVFSLSVVEGYQSVFNAQARTLVDQLKTRVGEEPFDIMHCLALTTFEAVCQTALGVACISDITETEKYYKAFNRVLELFILRGLSLLMHFNFIYRLTPEYKELKWNVAVLHRVSHTIIKKRKLQRQSLKNGSFDNTKDVKFRPVLDFLLDISETDSVFTEQQIKSEVDTIILGGQETVATTAFFLLLMIGSRPGVQAKLFKELSSIFGDSTRPVELEDLARMEYCEAVINETLRMFPPFPIVMRYADKEVQLKSCTVPVGTFCGINAWGSGRSKRIWGDDADEFIPERWLRKDSPRTAATFLAFSYGRRSCIGKKYAMAILKTIVAYCLRELEFTSDADQLKFKMDITLKATSGHLVQVKLRNQV